MPRVLRRCSLDGGGVDRLPALEDETQIELHGRYTPPLGTIGSALDSLIGHRVADASVHRFVTDVASLLRDELAADQPSTS
jgi:hypothetical protein